MYTIKNTSSKIIHIGPTVLMPDATMKAPESIAKAPSVKAMAGRKMLEITAPKVEAPKQEEAPDEKTDDQGGEGEGNAEQSGGEQAPEAATKAKGARRTTKKTAESNE